MLNPHIAPYKTAGFLESLYQIFCSILPPRQIISLVHFCSTVPFRFQDQKSNRQSHHPNQYRCSKTETYPRPILL